MEKTLYKYNKDSSYTIWSISVIDNKIITKWRKGEFGKLQNKEEIISSGKNLGKSNETTPSLQALLEAESKILLQKDKGYAETLEEAKELLSSLESLRPMLAHDYTIKNNKNKINWESGVIIQPKVDGIRMVSKLYKKLSGFDLQCVSRNNKPIELPTPLYNQIYHFMKINNLTYLDGELYIHGETFEDLVSCVKKPKDNILYDKLEYHIFEIPPISTLDLDRSFDISMYESIFFVESKLAHSEKEAQILLENYLHKHYEGIMLRNKYYSYEYNVRSYNLMKWKEFTTDEFEIVDIIPDKDGHGKLVCKLNNIEDLLFEAVPKGTHEYKSSIVQDKGLYLGKLATIKYQNLTSDGIPRFPVAIEIDRFSRE